MKKIKVLSVIGTRPEAIKMLPVIKLLEKDERFESVTVITAQHREMLDQVIERFNINVHYDLDVMSENQSLPALTAEIIQEMDQIFELETPDVVYVHGDTTTTLATGISAYYHKIPIGHVEAGLRTWDKYNPFPEEMNRLVTDAISDLYFVPTEESRQNLLREGREASNIFVTGNTAIDAFEYTLNETFEHSVLKKLSKEQQLLLVTMHRRENHGEPMKRVFNALRKIVAENEQVEIIFPVHLNPNVQQLAREYLGEQARIHLVEPLDVVTFHNLAAKSYLIITDSGGVQEEAPSLNVPVLVLRNETERPEGVAAGALRLIGTEEEVVQTAIQQLLVEQATYQKMAHARNPYGDGRAAQRILAGTYSYFQNEWTTENE